jgi:hypothetical protein
MFLRPLIRGDAKIKNTSRYLTRTNIQGPLLLLRKIIVLLITTGTTVHGGGGGGS